MDQLSHIVSLHTVLYVVVIVIVIFLVVLVCLSVCLDHVEIAARPPEIDAASG